MDRLKFFFLSSLCYSFTLVSSYSVRLPVAGRFRFISSSVLQQQSTQQQSGTSSIRASQLTVADLDHLSTKQALVSICGTIDYDNPSLLESKISICKAAPTICQYVIANPVVFFQNPKIAALYGVDVDIIPKSTPLTDLARLLPVIYIADNHPEYGMLGLQLNKKSNYTLNTAYDGIYSGLKTLRNRPVYIGGAQNRGSSFTMVHRKVGFPENRSWKTIPGNTEFRLFFSPDIAMANELCSTKDALPSEFKFFQFATIWQPRQLELEYDKKLWITINGPVQVIYCTARVASMRQGMGGSLNDDEY